jgi:hypothetical protein
MLSASRCCLPRLALRRALHVEARLKELGYKLPAVSAPKGSYVLCKWRRGGRQHFARLTAARACASMRG